MKTEMKKWMVSTLRSRHHMLVLYKHAVDHRESTAQVIFDFCLFSDKLESWDPF